MLFQVNTFLDEIYTDMYCVSVTNKLFVVMLYA